MKRKYNPTSKYYRVRCNETAEEKHFATESESIEWAAKVAFTFSQRMTFDVVRVIESTLSISADTNGVTGQ